MEHMWIGALTGAMMTAVCPAWAEQPLASSGLWNAYSADDSFGPVCGIATAGAEGRRIAIEQRDSQIGLTLRVEKPSWGIPEATPVELAISVDRGLALVERAIGSGPHLTAQLSFDDSVVLMRGLRRGAELHLQFPSGNEPAWTGGLRGSSAMTDAFNNCRRRFVTTAASPTQPFAPPSVPTQPALPPQAGVPTQPFTPAVPVPVIPTPSVSPEPPKP